MILTLILLIHSSPLFADDHPSPLSHLAVHSQLKAPRILIEGTGQLAVKQTIPAARSVRDAFLEADRIPPIFFFADDRSVVSCEDDLIKSIGEATKALKEFGLHYIEKSDPRQMEIYRGLLPEAVFVQTDSPKHLAPIVTNMGRAKSILVDAPFLEQADEFDLLKEVMRAHPETVVAGTSPYRAKMCMTKIQEVYLRKFLGDEITQISALWLDSEKHGQASEKAYQNMASAVDLFLHLDQTKLLKLMSSESLSASAWKIPLRPAWSSSQSLEIQFNAYVGQGLKPVGSSREEWHGLLIVGRNGNKVWFDLDHDQAIFISSDKQLTIRPLRQIHNVDVYEMTLFLLATEDFANDVIIPNLAFSVASAEAFFRFEDNILRRLKLFKNSKERTKKIRTTNLKHTFKSQINEAQLVFGTVKSKAGRLDGQELLDIPQFSF